VSLGAAPVTRRDREALNGHGGGVLYLTGLSGAGKSTVATRLEWGLHRLGVRTCLLDGDALRNGLCANLGFADTDRVENMRRVTEVARLMADAGIVVITALIAPFRAERDAARARFAPGDFLEVFVDAPLSVCEARDPKGLYRRARGGEIAQFTGIDSAYEPPLAPDLRVETARCTPDEAARALLGRLREIGFPQGSDASRSITRASSAGASTPVQTSAGAAHAGAGAGARRAQR
jgi:adenylylsulfate kinase